MEVTIFLFTIVYLIIIVAGMALALLWSRRRNLGVLSTAGVVLATLFVIYAVPFGDHTLGEIKKNSLCDEYGGTKIYQVAENVDGFIWNTVRLSKPFDTLGYAYREVRTVKNEIFLYEPGEGGAWHERRIDKSRSRYIVLSQREKLGAKHLLSQFAIRDIQQDKVLATYGIVSYSGGWLGLPGSMTCPTKGIEAYSLIKAVLKPTKNGSDM